MLKNWHGPIWARTTADRLSKVSIAGEPCPYGGRRRCWRRANAAILSSACQVSQPCQADLAHMGWGSHVALSAHLPSQALGHHVIDAVLLVLPVTTCAPLPLTQSTRGKGLRNDLRIAGVRMDRFVDDAQRHFLQITTQCLI